MDKGNYKLLQSRELEVARRTSKNRESFTGRKRIRDPFVRVFVVPTSRTIIIILIIAIVRECALKGTVLIVELNVDISIANITGRLIIPVNRNNGLDVYRNWTDVTLCRQELAARHIALSRSDFTRILEYASSASKHIKTLCRIKCKGYTLVSILVVPTSRAIIIVLVIAIVCKCTLERTILIVKLNIDFAIADVVAILVHGDELLDVQATTADGVKRAHGLAQELAHGLLLVADISTRGIGRREWRQGKGRGAEWIYYSENGEMGGKVKSCGKVGRMGWRVNWRKDLKKCSCRLVLCCATFL